MQCAYCHRPALARGMCTVHYGRWTRTGKVRESDPVGGWAPQVRFDRSVDRSGGPDACWPWTGPRGTQGYGRFWLNGKTTRAHRYALLGDGGAGLFVLHTCDNPPCCNPAHLRLGTLADNNRDRSVKGRSAPGSRMPHAKLSPGLAADIRARYAAGGVSQQTIADSLGVSQGLISQVVRGRHWRP